MITATRETHESISGMESVSTSLKPAQSSLIDSMFKMVTTFKVQTTTNPHITPTHNTLTQHPNSKRKDELERCKRTLTLTLTLIGRMS